MLKTFIIVFSIIFISRTEATTNKTCFLNDHRAGRLITFLKQQPSAIRIQGEMARMIFEANELTYSVQINKNWMAKIHAKKRRDKRWGIKDGALLNLKDIEISYFNEGWMSPNGGGTNLVMKFQNSSIRSAFIRIPFRVKLRDLLEGLRHPDIPFKISFPDLHFVDHQNECPEGAVTNF